MAKLDPRYDPLQQAQQGVIPQVNWAQDLAQQQAQAQQAQANAAQLGPTLQAAAAQQAQTQATAQQSAAARAAAGGIANQKDEEAADAMSRRYELAPKDKQIARQFQTADAIRHMGQSLNTGSTNGGAPNWAGALANVAGAYLGKKQQDEADAAAALQGSKYKDIASAYFGAAPKDSWF